NDTLDLRGHLRPAFGVSLDYAHKPLVVYDQLGTEQGAIVRHQLFVHAGASLTLVDRLRLGINLPLSVYQDGEFNVINGERLKPADKAALSDLRVGADVRVYGSFTEPFQMAAGFRVWVPTGVRSQFTSDGSARLGPHLSVAGSVGKIAYAGRLGV